MIESLDAEEQQEQYIQHIEHKPTVSVVDLNASFYSVLFL